MNLLQIQRQIEQMKTAFAAMQKTLLLVVEQTNKQSEVINKIKNQIDTLECFENQTKPKAKE